MDEGGEEKEEQEDEEEHQEEEGRLRANGKVEYFSLFQQKREGEKGRKG